MGYLQHCGSEVGFDSVTVVLNLHTNKLTVLLLAMGSPLARFMIGRWSQHRLKMLITILQKIFGPDCGLKSFVTG